MTITHFRGEYDFLSNFHPSPVFLDGVMYLTAEHAYQAAKTTLPSERAVIAAAATPREAKRLGRSVTVRNGWGDVKITVMESIVAYKFSAHSENKRRLLATGTEELVETNWWGDTFWGVCKGKGKNHLGQILMKVRDRLRAEQGDPSKYWHDRRNA